MVRSPHSAAAAPEGGRSSAAPRAAGRAPLAPVSCHCCHGGGGLGAGVFGVAAAAVPGLPESGFGLEGSAAQVQQG